MYDKMNVNVRLMEGRSYVIGREGHIYINDNSASKEHAEIKVTKGRIYLRDLNSTNGTYLVKNNKLVYFDEGYVRLEQPVVLGSRRYLIRDLLASAGIFAAYSEQSGMAFVFSKTQ